ncbi:MAG: DNA methylase [Planctomycetes bacterium RBG_16_41_13]|nr:MAG: DNA methylase [Planctomycetes bacterium RBG_16_41_13]
MNKKIWLQTLTLWDFPSQHYLREQEHAQNYKGATPSYIIWNLLQRYTRPGDVVIDTMCGAGTTLDVAKELNREALGFDLNPTRKDIKQADARKIPIEKATADFVFIDPPYSTHITYSGKENCIGELEATSGEYYAALEQVIREVHRILKPSRYMALLVSDSAKKGKPFLPIGFNLFSILSDYFLPVDIIAVTRHNAKLLRNHWHSAAVEGNYFLRGFGYLFIMYKMGKGETPGKWLDRRASEETQKQLDSFTIKKKNQAGFCNQPQ